MNLRSDMRQKNTQQRLDFHSAPTGETRQARGEGTESLPTAHTPESPASTNQFMEEICERENLKQALRQVKANKGNPGIDGMTVEELPGYLQQHWPATREQLLNGTYEPKPVRRVEIEKPDGGGMRKLGIPTVISNYTIGQLTFGMGRDPASFPSAPRSALSCTQDTTCSRC
jgi:RNA-directed DNA polymerase